MVWSPPPTDDHVLPQLCECEAVALIPGWSMSPGAQIEYQLAKYIGLKIIELAA